MNNHRTIAASAILAANEPSATATDAVTVNSPSNESNPQVRAQSRTPSSRSRSPSPSTTTSSQSTSTTGAHTSSSTSSTTDIRHHRHQDHTSPLDQATAANSACALENLDLKSSPTKHTTDNNTNTSQTARDNDSKATSIELRLLVRRREAGALIGKRGMNIKRLRDTFGSSMFSIPDTGNGPERVVCVVTDERWMEPILGDITRLLVEKSLEKDDQIELKLLIHSSQAGSIIGMGGQSIKKLRNDSRAAIKIYELCCPFSNERVCAIKAKPPVVVTTIRLIQSILNENPIKGTIKPYDALHFDLMLADKYGGYLPEEPLDFMAPHYPDQALHHPYHHHHSHHPHAHHPHPNHTHLSPHVHHHPHHFHHLQHQQHNHNQKHFGNQIWRASDQHQHPNNYKLHGDQVMALKQSPQQDMSGDKQSKRSGGGEQEQEGEDKGKPLDKEEFETSLSVRSSQATITPPANGRLGALASTRFHPYAANGDYNRFASGEYLNSPASQMRQIHHLSPQQRQALAYRGNLQQMRQLAPGAQYLRMPPVEPNVFSYGHSQPVERCRHRSLGACLCLFMPPAAQYISPSSINGDFVPILSPTVVAAAKTGFVNEKQR